MGSGRWDPGTWAAYSTTGKGSRASSPTVDHLYVDPSTGTTRVVIDPDLDPTKIVLRESVDSVDNPNSTPLIVALDVTGSMGMVLDSIARKGLGVIVEEVLKRKPITDPHLMFMAVGDVEKGDRSPLQVTQFEADNRITDQLLKFHLERGGGGNSYESYTLPWLFAALHTTTDSLKKRSKKGYLFTVGDEEPTPILYKNDINKVLKEGVEKDFTAQELLDMVSRQYNVFHIMIAEGSHARSVPDRVRTGWTNLLGQKAIWLEKHENLAEVIVSTIEVYEGRDKDDVVKSWSGDTSLVVANALRDLVKAPTVDAGVMRL